MNDKEQNKLGNAHDLMVIRDINSFRAPAILYSKSLGKSLTLDAPYLSNTIASLTGSSRSRAKLLVEETKLCTILYNPYIDHGLHDNNFNTYQPSTYKGAAKESATIPECYLNFLNTVMDGDAKSIEYTLDWMANSLRARNYTVLTLVGAPGIGKNLFSTIIERLHGAHNSSVVRDEVFKGRFNSQLHNKTFILIDEVKLRDVESLNRFKQIVNDTIEIEKKGRDAFLIKNFCNFVLASNSSDFMKLDYQDRRISLVKLSSKPLSQTIGDVDKVTKLVNDHLLNPKNLRALYSGLSARAVTHNMLVPFRDADTFEDIVQENLTDWEVKFLNESVPNRLGMDMSLSDAQRIISDSNIQMRRSPGRGALIRLASKSPGYFSVFKKHHKDGRQEWRIQVASAMPALKKSFTENTIDATEIFKVKFKDKE